MLKFRRRNPSWTISENCAELFGRPREPTRGVLITKLIQSWSGRARPLPLARSVSHVSAISATVDTG
jgi:hypothetical protein